MVSTINNSNEEISETNALIIDDRPGLFMCVFRIIFGIGYLFAIFFGVAGTLHWHAGWIFFSVNVFYQVVSLLLMYKYNPEMLKRKFPKDTKRFDKIFLALYIPLFQLEFVMGALDERFNLTGDFALPIIIAGSLVFAIAFALWLWAVVKNANFEITVRIQNDRDHKVCKSGPYRIVRHPAYTAGVFMFLATPVALSSVWAFIPGVILTIALIIRTHLEDKMLINELPGYIDFTHQTRYRLVPYIW